MGAECEVTRRVGRFQTHSRLEPLAVAVDQTDQRDGCVTYASCDPCQRIEDSLGFTVESSETLAPLSWIPANVSGEIVSGSGPTRTVTSTIPPGPETANFFRLRVTRP